MEYIVKLDNQEYTLDSVLSDAKIVAEKKEGNVFFRTKLEGEITFTRNAYTYLMSLDKLKEVEITIYQNGNLIYSGYFQRQNVVINPIKRTYSVTPQNKDEYTKLLTDLDDEYDLFSLDITQRITKQYNASSKYERLIVEDHNFTDCFDYWEALSLGEGWYYYWDGAGYRQQYDISNIFNELNPTWVGGLFGWSIESIEFVNTGTCTGGLTGFMRSTVVRELAYTYDDGDTPVAPSSGLWYNTGIVHSPVLRTWATAPYGRSYRATSSGTLTNNVFTNTNSILSDIDYVDTNPSTIDIPEVLKLSSVVNHLINKVDSSLSLSSNILLSDNIAVKYATFKTQLENIGVNTDFLTDNKIASLGIGTISNVMNPNASEADKNEMIKLSDILDLLKGMFNIYWKIDNFPPYGNIVVIEHLSYFEPSIVQDIEVNIKDSVTIDNLDITNYKTTSYKYNYFNLFAPNKVMYPIDYDTDEQQKQSIDINVDLASMISKSKGVSESGYTFISNANSNTSVQNLNDDLSLFILYERYLSYNDLTYKTSQQVLQSGSVTRQEQRAIPKTFANNKIEATTNNMAYGSVDVEQLVSTLLGNCEIIKATYNLKTNSYDLDLSILDF